MAWAINLSVISANSVGSHSSARSCLFARSQTTAVTSQTRAPESLTASLRRARARGFSTTGGGATAFGVITGAGAVALIGVVASGTTEMGAGLGVGPAAILGGRERRSARYFSNQIERREPR